MSRDWWPPALTGQGEREKRWEREFLRTKKQRHFGTLTTTWIERPELEMQIGIRIIDEKNKAINNNNNN